MSSVHTVQLVRSLRRKVRVSFLAFLRFRDLSASTQSLLRKGNATNDVPLSIPLKRLHTTLPIIEISLNATYVVYIETFTMTFLDRLGKIRKKKKKRWKGRNFDRNSWLISTLAEWVSFWISASEHRNFLFRNLHTWKLILPLIL